MSTITWRFIGGNADLPKALKAVMDRGGYPKDRTTGNGNFCAVFCHSPVRVEPGESGQPDWIRIREDCNGLCQTNKERQKYDYGLVARNEGSGGLHSETVMKQYFKVPLRDIEDILLFSERAPCRNCREALKNMDVDMTVFFAVPWTDTDESMDPVAMAEKPNAQDANSARLAVKDWRAKYR